MFKKVMIFKTDFYKTVNLKDVCTVVGIKSDLIEIMIVVTNIGEI